MYMLGMAKQKSKAYNEQKQNNLFSDYNSSPVWASSPKRVASMHSLDS